MQTDLKKEELGYALERLDVIKAKIGRYVFNKLFKIKRSQRLTKDLLIRKMDTVIKVSRDEIATEFGIARATTSLPVPLSPVISTVALVGATVLINSKIKRSDFQNI